MDFELHTSAGTSAIADVPWLHAAICSVSDDFALKARAFQGLMNTVSQRFIASTDLQRSLVPRQAVNRNYLLARSDQRQRPLFVEAM